MRKYRFWLIVASLVLATLFWRAVDGRGELGTDLLFGWIEFVGRVLPRVHIRWDGVGIFVSAFIAAVVVLHLFMCWVMRELANRSSHVPRQWRLRWTLMLSGLTILMFVAGIAMIGATHQVAWLLKSDEPLFGRDVVLPYAQNSPGQLKYIGMGLSNASDVYNTLPTRAREKPGEARHSWVTYSLVFLGYTAEIDLTRSWDDPANATHFKSLVPSVLNPEFRTAPIRNQDGYGLNHYAGNSRIFGSNRRFFPNNSSSNTLLIGEVNSQFVPWGDPDNSRDPANGINAPNGFGGADRRGAHFSMLDGSVRFINKDVDVRVLEQLAEPKH